MLSLFRALEGRDGDRSSETCRQGVRIWCGVLGFGFGEKGGVVGGVKMVGGEDGGRGGDGGSEDDGRGIGRWMLGYMAGKL